MPLTATLQDGSTVRIQVRDHEYAPWRDLEVKASYARDDLGFFWFEPSDGERLERVHHRDARQRNPGWTPGSLCRRWVRLPT